MVIELPYSSETLELAKSELIKYSELRFSPQKSTLKVIFSIDEKLNSHLVKSVENTLHFIGKNDVELLYAVYNFGEKVLGFLFFEPGQDTIPNSKDPVTIEGNAIIISDKKYKLKRRGFIQEFPFGTDSVELFDWMAKRRMNYLLTWMKYYDQLSEEMRTFATIRGIEFESGHHNFNYWIPAHKYLQNHGDFFAEINGQRITPSSAKSTLLLSEQLCTTNPKLRRKIVNNMVNYCNSHPEIKTISLIPNDGFGWCECENCSKFYDKNLKGDIYNVSKHVYKADKIYHNLIADISQQLSPQRPDITLTFCAYVNYSAPADGFRLEHGNAVHFAPYWRCINHAIDDPNCSINANYIKDLQKWQKAKNGGEINIYEYYMGVNLYVSLPMIHFSEMFREIEFYHQERIDGLLTQFSLKHWRAYGMNYFFMSKASCGEDFECSYSDLLTKLYGRNGTKVKEFYARLKEILKNLGSCHIPYPYSLFSRIDGDALRDLFSFAQEIAQEIESKIWQEVVIWCEYMVKFYELFTKYHQKELAISDIETFRNWVHSFSTYRIVLDEKLDLLLNAWVFAIENNRPYLHFNLDWEDEYIKIHARKK